MSRHKLLCSILLGSAAAFFATAAAASAEPHDFNIPGGDLKSALEAYAHQSGVQIIYPVDQVSRAHTGGVRGFMESEIALSRILRGTNFIEQHDSSGAISVVSGGVTLRDADISPVRLAAAAAAASSAGIESVVVTSSKIKGDIQTVPIAITALSQEQLTSRQIAGGPDLVKEVPNLTFSKTNFSGYTIQIRGIGTQAISVTTDPAVAVALNDVPFIRNHFFEQEFYDLSQAEVLRGPQGTLYGRNATAGVVNIVSAKPTDQFEAMLSADWGNYTNRRYEGMINIPIVDDRLDLRVAGEWTKRNGYSTNEITGNPIDGRDLWSSRVTIGWKPFEKIQATFVWEHFQEDDDRLRTSKQLCKTDPTPTSVLGQPVTNRGVTPLEAPVYLGQGCLPTGLYSSDAFEVPNGVTLPYFDPLKFSGAPLTGFGVGVFDPYANTTQSHDLRVIESQIDPQYKAKNDTLELNVDYSMTPDLTFTSQTGYNQDFLWSTEDYNRFNTRPGAFTVDDSALHSTTPDPSGAGVCLASEFQCAGLPLAAPCDATILPPAGFEPACSASGIFCDPQIGCSNRLVAQDLNDEHSWQLSQEFRLASNFTGPFNFSFGGNFMHYETEENYYVFINTVTAAAYTWRHGGELLDQTQPWVPGVSDNSNCMVGGFSVANPLNPSNLGPEGAAQCMYIDPNPLSSLNNQGHNYFLSQNPYVLNSYAGFGEVYYNVTSDLKLTGGLRWTDDKKHFVDIPSQLLVYGYGYPITGVVDQEWQKYTGRFAVNWMPKLDFTDQTMAYASAAHGYKAGGANPPGATLLQYDNAGVTDPIHPLTFKPEFIDAYELGTKNTMLDGGLTLNGDVFFYNYTGYQISRIVDRTAINDNFDATVKGTEIEATYEPIPGLKFNFAGGYEDTRIKNGQSSVDLMDRADTAEHPGWMVVKPFVTQASNCVIPDYVVAGILYSSNVPSSDTNGLFPDGGGISGICSSSYIYHLDPLTELQYAANPAVTGSGAETIPRGYPGYDPLAGTPGHPYTGQNTFNGVDYGPTPNNGEGFSKNLSGNELPNAPHFTTSLSADYTIPVSEDWAATVHSDFYWQSQSWARVFNDRPYDKLRGYSNVNLALILTSASGWQVMGYLKNVFDKTAITGDFLNSDDSGLTTNVFLTDPRLFGVRVTKNW